MGTPTAFFLAYTVCFALMHPIGIAIGLGVSQLSMNDAGYEGLNSTLQGDSQLSGVIQSNMVPTREENLKGPKLIFLCNLWIEINLLYLI